VLPRLTDVVNDAVALGQCCEKGESIAFLVFDIADAFNNIPVRPDERRFTCASIGGKFIVFDSLVFGSGSSPTVWGRFAAWLGRSIVAICDEWRLRAQVYVDDPLLVVRG
jgi:hypothetical protein